jgi:hypothetical protein
VALHVEARTARAATTFQATSGAIAIQWARRRATPIACTVAVAVVGMTLSLLWVPLVDHMSGWMAPPDLWQTFRDAHLVGWGGEAAIYQAGTDFLSPPALPVVLAPVAMLSGALHLTESFLIMLPHPTAWLLLGPADFLCGSVVFFALDATARRLGVPRARRVAAQWVCAGLSLPLLWLWGHPEDLVALSFVLYALLAAFDGRWARASVLVGLGLAFQPLVVLVAPLVFARLTWRELPRSLAVAAAPGAALLVFPLAHAWRTTWRAVVEQPTFPTLGHGTPWLALAPVLQAHRTSVVPAAERLFSAPVETTAGGPARLLAIALAVVIGVVVARTRPSEHVVIWLAAGCLALRCVFESVMFPYYVVPALLVVVLAAAAVSSRRLALAVVAAGACSWAAYVRAEPWAYYLVVSGLLVAAFAFVAPRRSAPTEREPARCSLLQQRAGEPGGGGVELGSNGSREAPQLGSVRGAWALPAAGELAGAEGAETVATVRVLGGASAGAAEL